MTRLADFMTARQDVKWIEQLCQWADKVWNYPSEQSQRNGVAAAKIPVRNFACQPGRQYYRD